jgi:hypothetical protein
MRKGRPSSRPICIFAASRDLYAPRRLVKLKLPPLRTKQLLNLIAGFRAAWVPG